MPIDLMPWLILWAIVTTVVVILAVWRVVGGLHDIGSIHLGRTGDKETERETRFSRKLDRVERWGQVLTVLSAILIAGIGVAWLYNGWLITSK